METARPALKASPVRVIYNATSNTFDPRRWRRQIRIYARAIVRRNPSAAAPIPAKYLRAFYSTTRGTLRRGAAKVAP